MNEAELTAIIARGEDSRHQFKRDFSNIDSLAAELIAFANTRGGSLLIGVDDSGNVGGLDVADVSVNYTFLLCQSIQKSAKFHISTYR